MSIKKNHVSVPNSKVIENKKIRIVLHFLFFFFFHFLSFFNHIFWFFFSLFFFKFFLNSHWFGVYFFSVFNLFFYFISFAIRSIAHSLTYTPINILRVPYFLIFFLFSLKISRVFFPKPTKLLLIQPTKFLPQSTSKLSP